MSKKLTRKALVKFKAKRDVRQEVPETYQRSTLPVEQALSTDRNPSFATILKVARALGIKLHAEAA